MSGLTSLQECYDALEKGFILTLWDGGTLHKRPTGEYAYIPRQINSIVAQDNRDRACTCEDRDSLFAFLVLREAIFEPQFVEADSVVSEWAHSR